MVIGHYGNISVEVIIRIKCIHIISSLLPHTPHYHYSHMVLTVISLKYYHINTTTFIIVDVKSKLALLARHTLLVVMPPLLYFQEDIYIMVLRRCYYNAIRLSYHIVEYMTLIIIIARYINTAHAINYYQECRAYIPGYISLMSLRRNTQC